MSKITATAQAFADTPPNNIGPGSIATPSVPKGPGLALAATEWVSIQTYVIDALALPTDQASFKTFLGTGAPSDLSDFTQLITAYATINGHVTTWQNDTFPASVSLASDIYAYSQQAPVYYGAINPLADILTKDPNNQDAKDKLAGILDVLSASAATNHDNAAAVFTKIQTFATTTQADKTTLSGTDGASGLQKYYNDKYGATSTEVTNYTNQLASEKTILDSANAEYKEDVIIASTTPTYAWVWPFGTIAAGVVAGIYGDKAVKALQRAKDAQDQINTLNAQLQADAALMAALTLTNASVKTIVNDINNALPIIQKIQGQWGAIRDDLSTISGVIKTNIQQALPIVMSLGVQLAINDWTAVGLAADKYRQNAYVTVNK